MTKLINALPLNFRDAFTKFLKDKGYCKQVEIDETQAYLATSSMIDIVDHIVDTGIEIEIPWAHVLQFQKYFDRFHTGDQDAK